MLKKFLAGLSVLALSLGMIALVAGPASAHTGDLNVTAVCNANTGQYDLTATLTIAKTTEDGTTYWKSGTSNFEGTPGPSTPQFANGPVLSTHNPGTITLGTIHLPGSTTGLGPWFYAETVFTGDNYFVGSDGQLINRLDGTCGDTPDSKKITFCHYDGSNNNGGSGKYSGITTSLWAFYQAGHVNHSNDIFPAGSVVHQGVTYSWPAQGNQALLQYPDCVMQVTPTAPTFTQPVCTATGTVGQGTVTIPTGVTGVDYYVKVGNGSYSPVAQGAVLYYNQGQTVTVQARAVDGNILTSHDRNKDDQKTFDSVTFGGPDASKCVQPAAPTVVQAVCTGQPGGIGQASYTIVATNHVTYKVNGITVTGGPHYVAPGSTVVVTYSIQQGYTLVGPASITLTFSNPGDCLTPVTATPGHDNSTCVVDQPGVATSGYYTIPATAGINWTVTVDGAPASNTPGQHNVSPTAHIVIDAVAQTGYNLTGQTHFDWTLTSPGDCKAPATVATAPTYSDSVCIVDKPGQQTDSSYTLTAATGIDYSVSTDNVTFVPVAAGANIPIPAGTHLWIHATPQSGYYITGTAEWDHVFPNPGADCLQNATSSDPTFVDAVCNVDKPGTHTQASYTVVSATHVHYEVSTDLGATWTPATPDVAVDVAPGSSVWVQAFADSGYKLTTPGLTKHDFPAVGDCLVTVIPVAPGHTDETCTVDENLHGHFHSGTIILPATTGIEYAIDGTVPNPADGTPVLGGTAFPVSDGSHSVSAMALTGYTLDASYTGPYLVTIAAAEACGDLIDHPLVTPIVVSVQPTCTAEGSYTLSNDLDTAGAVIWTVDGSPVSEGTYQVAGNRTVHIHAAANGPDFGFTDGQQQDWTLTFSVPANCDLKTLALTGSSPVGGIVLAYFLLIAGIGIVTVRTVRRRPVRDPQE